MLIRKGLQPTLQKNPGNRERIIFHLDLDAFFAQVEEVADPRLRGKPVFVVGHSMTSGVVLTANYVARQFGVKTGMPLREARKLCPAAVLVPADCSKYADTSEQIFAHLTRYTPLVEIFSIDEAFMDVTDARPLLLAREIKRWVMENFGLTISVGIAPNKLLAKLASGWEKPDGLFRIRSEDVPGFFQTLPVEELCGIGSRLKSHLNQMGVRTAAELGAFPEMELFRRFGVTGLVLKRMGQGVDHSPVLPMDHSEPVKSVGHSYTLTRAIRDRREALRYLFWLSEKVGRRLRRRALEGRTVHTTVRFSDFETFSRQKNLSLFLNDGKTIFEYARKIFAEIDRPGADAPGLQSGSQTGRLSASGPGRPLRLLGVSVSGLRPAGREPWLFESLNRRHSLLEAVDAVNDKYGEFTLHPAFLNFPGDRKIASRALQLFGGGRH